MDALQERINRCMQQIAEKKENNNEQTLKYQCNICKDTEWIFKKDENGREFASRCSCFEKKQALRIMASSGISEADLQRGFADFETFEESGLVAAKNTAINYYKEFKGIEGERNNSLLLSGASGRGKTTLGMAVVNNLIKRLAVNVRYMPYREEITRLKQTVTDEENYKNAIERLKRTRVLFIDDLFKGKITESDINIVYEIINYRYLERLPIIVSTELAVPELVEVDEAIAGRIVEMCKGYVVTLDSSIPNYRMR